MTTPENPYNDAWQAYSPTGANYTGNQQPGVAQPGGVNPAVPGETPGDNSMGLPYTQSYDANMAPYGTGVYGAGVGGYPVNYAYNYPPAGMPYMAAPPKNGAAGWALGLTITGWLLTSSVFGMLISWAVAIAGLIVSGFAVSKAKKLPEPYRNMGMSMTSLVLSILHIALFVAIIGLIVVAGLTLEEPVTDIT